MRRRPGYTLIEVVMAMTVGFILLGCGVRLLALVVRIDRSQRSRLFDESSLDRLARRFRDDVASAVELPVQADVERGQLALKQPSGKEARYELENEAIVRVELQADKPVGCERYTLPKRLVPRFEVVKRDGTDWVRLRWKPGPGPSENRPAEPVPLEAPLSRFARLDAKEGVGDAK